jgi:hypothetical protein
MPGSGLLLKPMDLNTIVLSLIASSYLVNKSLSIINLNFNEPSSSRFLPFKL